MLSTLKRFFTGLVILLAVIAVLVAALFAYLLLGFDANMLKPQIYSLAEKHGIELKIDGDLDWQLYPNIALTVAEVSAYDKDQQSTAVLPGNDAQLLFASESASLVLALRPLFKQELDVEAIAFDGLRVHYYRDAEGNSNWDSLKAENEENAEPIDLIDEDTERPEQASQELSLSIAEITLNDAQFSVYDAFQVKAEAFEATLRVTSSTISNISLAPQDMSLKLEGNIESTQVPIIEYTISASLSGIFDKDKTTSGAGQAGPATQSTMPLGIQLENVELVLTPKGTERSLKLSAENQIYFEPLSVQGQLKLEADEMGAWLNDLATEAVDILSTIDKTQVSANYRYDPLDGAHSDFKMIMASHSINDSKLKQQSVMSGTVKAKKLQEQAEYSGQLHIDSLNANYFIADTEIEAKGTAGNNTANKAPAEDIQLPLELLRALQLDLELSMDELRYQDLSLTTLQIKADANDALLDIQSNGDLLAGAQTKASSYQLAAQYTLKSKPGKFQLNAEAKALDSQALLSSFLDLEAISGLVDTQVSANSQGDTLQSLMSSLKATLKLQSPQFKLQPVNLEKLYCDAIALVDGTLEDTLKNKLNTALSGGTQAQEGTAKTENTWPKYTLTQAAELVAYYQNGEITLQHFSTGVEQLSAQAEGHYELSSGEFRIPISLSLTQMIEGHSQCGVTSDKWLKQKLPIVCKGSIDSVGIGSCNLDSSYIKERANTLIERETQKQVDNAEKRLEKEATKQLEKYLDKDKVDKLKELFK